MDRRGLIRLAAKGAAAGVAIAAGGTFAGSMAGVAVAAPVPGPDPLRGMPRSLALSVPRGIDGDAPLPPLPDLLAEGRLSPPSRRIPYAQGAPTGRAAREVPAALPFAFNRSGYTIAAELPEHLRPWRDRPKRYEDISPDEDKSFLDSEGVLQIREGRGKPGYDHPVSQIQFGLACIASYRTEKDASRKALFLTRAKAQAKRLIDRRVEARGVWYFPYPFDYTHTEHSGIDYKAPWYSGMAQGEAISLFIQLSQLDAIADAERALYRTAADNAFASLLLGDEAYPWVVHKDAAGYLWIQEYPGARPGTGDFTYNGMIFAMFGLWDYYTATGNELALALYDGSASTIARYFPLLRNVRWHSYYCQTHRIPAPTYHQHHINLFRQLHWQTGSPDFAHHTDVLTDDYPSPYLREGATVALAAGTHTLYRISTPADGDWDRTTGDVELEQKKVAFTRATQAPADMRRRIKDRGIYYRLSAGAYSGWWVGESWPNSFLRGQYLTTAYRPQRTLTFPGGNQQTDVYRFTEDGTAVSIKTLSFSTPSNTSADRRAIVNGRPMYQITAGDLVGYWVPATGVTADGQPAARPWRRYPASATDRHSAK
ncbi:D-glucuronyl C5-epimerase family protein [Streptomyces sp. HMX112]|uniref:D-glucuronyl C5-epimerase family protein n=1 Tax=Streptomyces sp. HMX112 TaxID=3390850 RepID=UPI003A810A78